MSESDSAPPSPKPRAPAASRERGFWVLLRTFGDEQKWPWWLWLAGVVIIGLPQVADGLRDWAELLGGLGGGVAMFLAALASPILTAALITLGVWGVVCADSNTGFGRAIGAFGRLLAVGLVAVCATAGLFGHLIASSDIPAAVGHYQRASALRHVSQPQREILFHELRRASDRIP